MCSTAPEKNKKKQDTANISKEQDVQEAAFSLHLMLWISIISNFVRKVRLYKYFYVALFQISILTRYVRKVTRLIRENSFN